MSSENWILYGANGYTGRRIAQEACRRGLRPILAGRNRPAIESLAGELGCEARVFDLVGVEEIARQLAGANVVLHAAGPFSATAEPMQEACLRAKVNYLDLTGEIDVIQSAAARHDRAAAAGIAILPAVGFDVVPSDCLAAMLAARLPSAVRLELAFTGTGGLSPGTAKTMLEGMPQGGRARIGGRIERVPVAWKAMKIPFHGGPRWAATIPWGDVATAYYSTGIANIETYLAMPRAAILALRCSRWAIPWLRSARVQRMLRRRIERRVAGPTPEAYERSRASLWGRVTDGEGHSVEATLETPGGYPLTVLASLAAVQRVLAGAVPPGFSTPSKAFGKEFVLGIPGVEMFFSPQCQGRM
ncbi:MAG: saccharopine dehydrogenase family protein [Pirellulales bacterium]